MSEENKNMEDLLQSELDLGDTEAVGAADDPFANIGANDDPFAGVNGTEDTFVDIENDNNNPFNDVAAEKTTEAGEMTAEETGTEAVSETGVSEDAPAKSEMIKKPEKTGVEETEHKEKAVGNNANVQDEQKISDESGEQSSSNPFEAEIDRVETKAAEETKTGLLNKPPVFKYAGATEDITDLSQTFEAIRKAKAEDFPELEDGKRVSWKMDYCGVVKNVAQPTKTTIAEQKKLIEESKDFLTAIKRKKGDFSCKVIPTVTAQKKGQMPVYKGIFSNEEKALNSGKAITYVPSEDGNVYEIGHIIQNKLNVVLVDVSEIKENGKKEAEYRWFEIPEGFHENNTVNSKFELGRTLITANAKKELDFPSVLQILLTRYMQGDWGNLCESDKQLNDNALKYGDRIFASYTDANDRKFWIITEADRSATTVLLPEDY